MDKCLAALDAGAARAAVDGTALVARPGFRKIHAEPGTLGGDVGLGQGDERAQQLDAGVGAQTHGFAHRVHEFFAAIRVDRVVAAVRGDDQPLGTHAFGKPSGDRKHDGVTKRHHGLLHVRRLVMAVGDIAAGGEQIGSEQAVNKIEFHHLVAQAEPGGGCCGEGQFARIVFGPVVKTDDGGHYMVKLRPLERGHRIHSTRAQDDNLHAAMAAKRGPKRKGNRITPVRARNRPNTRADFQSAFRPVRRPHPSRLDVRATYF